MAVDTINTPSAQLKEFDAAAGTAFREMRNAVGTSGPLDRVTQELIILGGFVVQGFELPFKIHALRLLRDGIELQALRQAVLLMLGASLPLYPVMQALTWIDDVATQHQAEQGLPSPPQQEES